MSIRLTLFTWFAAFMMAITGALALAHQAPKILDLIGTEKTAPVVVIGSSLSRYSISANANSTGWLLGDGRDHHRLGVPGLKEHEAVGLLNRAIDAGAETILLQMDPFITLKRNQAIKEDRQVWLTQVIAQPIVEFGRTAKAGLGTLFGYESADMNRIVRALQDVPRRIDKRYRFNEKNAARFYPMVPRDPLNPAALKAAVASAKSAGIEIILFKPPHSETASRYLGVESAHALTAKAQELADEHELDLFHPASNWPDTFFVDRAHMNRLGRARFMSELRNWAAGRS